MKKLFLLSISMLILTGCGDILEPGIPCYDSKAQNFAGYFNQNILLDDTSDCIYCDDKEEFDYWHYNENSSKSYEEQYEDYLYYNCCNITNALNYNDGGEPTEWNTSQDSTHCVFE